MGIKIAKESLLLSLEASVEAHTAIAIREFQNLDESALLQTSHSGGWSIAQCLDHLNGYGHHYLPEMQKAMQKADSQPESGQFEGSWLGDYFTKMMDPATAKKMKAFKNHVPPAKLEAHNVVAEFIQQQEQLMLLLTKARIIDLSSVGVPISISKLIRINLGDTFRFFIMHNERHIRQALRNIK